MNTKYKHLFSPLTIRGITLKNRIEAAPISVFDLSNTPERHLSERDMDFFRVRAMGGAAIVTLGDAIVHPSGIDTGNLPSPKVMACNDDNLFYLTRLADEIHRYGAIASIELNHAGMLSTSDEFSGWGPDYINFTESKIIAPLSDQAESDEPVYRKGEVLYMTEEMIEEVVDGFGTSALRAKQCGFEMAMIHAGHGWLIQQFMSPLTNHRTDRFGGSLENRARLLIMIIDRIRHYCGEDFIIEARISGTEYVEGGYTIEDGIEFAKLIDGKVDVLHISAGNFYHPETECLMIPTSFGGNGFHVHLAEQIKKNVKSHVAALGALVDPAMMEDILLSGKADIISMCRTLNADPMFPNKVRRGQEEEVRPCIRCTSCLSSYQTRFTKCSVNPTFHRPFDVLVPRHPSLPKKVLIAGGGPGGMQAAITAKERGHDVILCEKSDRLGGLIRYSKDVPFKKDMERYLQYMVKKVDRIGIDIRLNTEVTPELIKEINPDACIAAIGSIPMIPNIKGIEFAHPIMDMHDKKFETGDTIAIIGAGLAGSEAAVELAMKGKKVKLIEIESTIARDANSVHRPALLNEIKKYSSLIDVLTNTSCKEIKADGLACITKNGEEVFVEADSVVFATGMKALSDDVNAFRELTDEFKYIGDCRKPRQIGQAILEAYDAAMDI
ncbi:FAD-dependent oxidoreductase [Bacillota bacterium]